MTAAECVLCFLTSEPTNNNCYNELNYYSLKKCRYTFVLGLKTKECLNDSFFMISKKMGIKIPEHIRSAIIDAWLRGETRDHIAAEVQVAEGTVSNVIEEWQNRIGVFDANNLRKLV
jgi:hypothetical protein